MFTFKSSPSYKYYTGLHTLFPAMGLDFSTQSVFATILCYSFSGFLEVNLFPSLAHEWRSWPRVDLYRDTHLTSQCKHSRLSAEPKWATLGVIWQPETKQSPQRSEQFYV